MKSDQINRYGGSEVAQESLIGMVFAISEGGMGPFVYQIAPPDQLVSRKE